jgi:hypothetical protein
MPNIIKLPSYKEAIKQEKQALQKQVDKISDVKIAEILTKILILIK